MSETTQQSQHQHHHHHHKKDESEKFKEHQLRMTSLKRQAANITFDVLCILAIVVVIAVLVVYLF